MIKHLLTESSLRAWRQGGLFSKCVLPSCLGLTLLAGGVGQAQTCDLYPIALSSQSLSNVSPGTVLNIFNGTQSGNFGWLSWAGGSSEPTLVQSLTPPGNSSTYVNPDNANDHKLDVSDWVQGKPGVSNGKSVRDALDDLEKMDITVPVWDHARGSGANAAYRVSAFAQVRIQSYHLSGQNRITAKFLGYASCQPTNRPPVANAGPDRAILLPSTATLQGTVSDDGLAAGSKLVANWTKVSGPAPVAFSVSSLTNTLAGTAITNPFSVTATFPVAGVYVLRLTATDSQFTSSDDVTVVATGLNVAPTAYAQSVTLNENTATNITLQGKNPGSNLLSYAVITLPNHGTLTGTAPALTYTPTPNFSGADSFSFRVNDGTNVSTPAIVALTVRPVDQVPLVNAGSDLLIVLPADATLNGSVVFHPFPGASPAVLWTKVSGPGPVTFDNASNAVTAATFNQSGVYRLRLTASDSFLSSSDDVIVTVDAPPTVQAGPSQSNSFPATVTLRGSVQDDGLPTNQVLTVAWSKLSGPGTVTFVDASVTNTMASFSASGNYVLRLTANDGVASAFSDMTVVISQPIIVIPPVSCDHPGVTVKGYTALQYQSNFLYDIVFALDTSGSTVRGTGFDLNGDGREDTVFEAEVEACRRLTRMLTDTNHIRFGLVKFARYHTKNAPDGTESDGPVLPDETRVVQSVTSDPVVFQAALDTVASEGAKGGTDIAAGIDLAVQDLTNTSTVGGDFKTTPVRHIILLTDGIPTLPVEDGFNQERGDRRATLAAAQRAALAGIAIHPVVLDATNRIERKLTTMPAVQAITGVPGEVVRINTNNVQQLADILSGLSLPSIPQVKVYDLTSGTNWTITVQPNGWFEALLPVKIGTNNWEFRFSSGDLGASQTVMHSVSFVVYPSTAVVDITALGASNAPVCNLTSLERPSGSGHLWDGGPEYSLLSVLTNKTPQARVLPGVESFRTVGGTMTLEFIFKGAGYNSDVGYFLFDPANPPRTAAEVMAGVYQTNIFLNSSIVPNNTLNVSGLVNTIQVQPGMAVGLFMIPNGTLADAKAGRGNSPLFTLASLNPGQFAQATTFYDPVGHQIVCAFEDIEIMSNNSDLDYQDLVFTVKPIDPLPQSTECITP